MTVGKMPYCWHTFCRDIKGRGGYLNSDYVHIYIYILSNGASNGKEHGT